MAVHEDLDVRYHQQDTTFSCGPACAQMFLANVGAGLLDEGDLEADIGNHNTIEGGWASAPDGLQWTLNNRCPASLAGSIGLLALTSEDAISRKIVWSIHNGKVPAIALISGMSHWIVVRGYEASAAPASAGDTSYSITSFDINNPSPPVPSAPPPPHAGTDECGTGGDRGFTDEHLAYGTWKSIYMTGVPTGSHWTGKFVAACAADATRAGRGKSTPEAKKEKGDRIVPPELVRELAVAGLQEYGLYERQAWKKALARTTPGEPMLVQRLDRLDTFYYIVPMQVSRKIIPALVCVDGRFGNYQQAARIAKPGGNALAGLSFDASAALEKVLTRPVDLGRRRGRLQVRKEACSLHPALVWRPCRESMSPYVPFFMFTIGAARIYLRVDGQIFRTLHINDRGI